MTRAFLAGAALALAVAAWASPDARRTPTALAARVGEGIPRIAALDLARALRDRAVGLRIADARPALEPGDLSVPRAVPLDLEADVALARDSLGLKWVLYDEGGGEAAAAWFVLTAAGADAALLAGGMDGWVEQVLEPVFPADLPDSLEAYAAEARDLSRYFGGTPRVARAGEEATVLLGGPPLSGASDTTPRVRRRGGCGWNEEP